MSNPYYDHLKKIKKTPSQGSKSEITSKFPTPKKRKKAPPLGAIFCCLVILAGGVWTYDNVEKVEEFLSGLEIRLFNVAGAQSDEQNLPTEKKKKEEVAEKKVQTEKVAEEKSRALTPEELILFNKLEERRKTLDQKEEELALLEAELQQQKVLLEEKLEQLDMVRRNIASQLEEKVEGDADRVDKLVAFYSNMKPKNAAKVFESIDEDLAVEVLKKMKKRNAAEIMNLVEPKKAQALSEKFAGYRKR